MKIYIKICLLLSFLIAGFQQSSNAQIEHSCGSDHVREQLYKSNPTLQKDSKKSLGKLVDGLRNKMKGGEDGKETSAFRTTDDEYVIPVVVHVLYGCENEEEDLPIDRIQNAIDELNEDFNGLNACDNLDADGNPENCDNQFPNEVGGMKVTFALAHKDPNGNPTTGINRVKNSKTYEGIGGYEELAEIVQWDRANYMNIYILNKVTPQQNSGIAHYPQTSDGNALLDAVCIAYWAVDPDPAGERRNYDYILTHEVGHWFGLPHIWGNGNAPEVEANCNIDDFDFLQEYIDDNGITDFSVSDINDTPTTLGHSTIAKEIGETEDCTSPRTTCGSQDMFDNFMDYSGCAKMFSKGQVEYMTSLLGTSLAARDTLVSADNIGNVFYDASSDAALFSNTTNRAVFERSIFYESSANNGSISNALNVEIKGQASNNWAYNYTTAQSGFITVTPSLPSGLTAKLSTSTATKIGKVTISGSTTQEVSGEYTFVINSNMLPNVNLTERTKKVRLEFDESDGVTYQDINPNKLIGPQADYQGNINTPFGYFRLRYDDGFSVYMDADTKLRVGMQGSAGNYSIKKFTSTSQYVNSSTFFGDGLSTFDDDYWDNDVYPLDVSTLNDGDTFYLGLRGGVCDADLLKEHYGWVELEKVGSPGDDCEAILVKDFAFNSSSSTSYIYVGYLDQPLVRFSDSILKEDLQTDGLFNEIELTLKGSHNFAIAPSTTPLASNQYSFVAYDDNPNDNNDVVIPPDFDSKVKVTITGSKTATISIPSTWDLDNEDDFKVRFSFGSGVLVNVDYEYSSAGVISVDFRGADEMIFADMGAFNVETNVGDDKGKIIYFDHLDHEWGTELGFFYFGDGFQMYKGGGLPQRVEALCDTDLTEFTSGTSTYYAGHMQLFDIDQFQNQSVVDGLLNNGTFRHVGPGGYSNEPHVPLDGEVYLSDDRMDTWKLTSSEAYIFLRVTTSCDEIYYAWMRLELEADGSITPYYVLYQTTPNDQTWDTIATCTSGSESTSIYIDEVYVTDTANPGGSSISNDQTSMSDIGKSNYTDFTSEIVTTYPGSTLSIQAVQGFADSFHESTYLTQWDEHWGVWIDFNDDGYFAMDGSEKLVFNNLDDLLDVEVDIPNNVSPGTYKMRVILSLHSIYGACQPYTTGETEDYTVEIRDITELECDGNELDLTNPLNGTDVLRASTIIEANDIVGSSADIDMIAGEHILLLPGFQAEKGADLRGFIAECVQVLPKAEAAVEAAPLSNLSELSAYPNPFDNEVKIDFSLLEEGDVNILLFNVNGKLISKQSEVYAAGSHSLDVYTGNLVPGMYVLKVIGRDFDEQLKLVKMQ